MKNRTRTMLSILLAVSMVLSVNVAAMGGVRGEGTRIPAKNLKLISDPSAEGYEGGDYKKQGERDAKALVDEETGKNFGYIAGYTDGENDGYEDGLSDGGAEKLPDINESNFDYDLPEDLDDIEGLLDEETVAILEAWLEDEEAGPPSDAKAYIKGFIEAYSEEYKEGFKEGYKEGYVEGYLEGQDYDDYLAPTSGTQTTKIDHSLLMSKDKTKVDFTDGVKITGLSMNKAEEVVNLRETWTGKSVIQTILTGGAPEKDTYLVNKMDIPVSQTQTTSPYDIEGMERPYLYTYYDVVPLEDGNFIFLEYYSNMLDNDDGYYGWVEGVEEPIPVLRYTGQKIECWKPKAKDSKSKRYGIVINAALVKFAEGTLEMIPGLSVASGKVDKNGKDASVSGESITVKGTKTYDGIEYKDSYYLEYKAAGNAKAIPTFTVKFKAADAAKASAKAIKKKMKDKKYQFAIRQRLVVVRKPNGSSTSLDPEKGTLSFNNTAVFGSETYMIDTGTLDFSDVYYNEGIMISKFNGKKATITAPFRFEGKTGATTLKQDKDYVLDKGKLGKDDTEITYIKEFKGNYVYSRDRGIYDSDYMIAFRKSPVDGKLLRGGVFKADGDGFVYSAE